MDQDYLKRIFSTVVIISLALLVFFMIKPLFSAGILGIILAFIFAPVYKSLERRIKSENIRAILMSFLLMIIVLIPLILLAPRIISQVVSVYFASSKVNFVEILGRISPYLTSSEIPTILQSIFDSSVSKAANSLANSISIDNLVSYFLKSLVTIFAFFFFLKDREQFVSYLKSLIPFSKEVQNKLFERSKEITSSIIYGQVVVGILQGAVAGAGFFLFGVSNALFLTLLAILAGIFPIIATTIVWLPVAIYLLAIGNTFSAIGVSLFGIVSTSIDNFVRPLVVSRRSQMHPALVLVGMIGGLFLFGMLGLIVGPLILAYLLILVEVYRNRENSLIFCPVR